MQAPRFYTESILQLENTCTVSSTTSHRILKVLRLSVGANISLFNGDGYDYKCEIMSCTKNAVSVQVIQKTMINTESPVAIHLGQAIIKGERMDYCIQKSTELGVSSITPLVGSRTVVKLNSKTTISKLSHWQKIAIHAAEQCGRAKITKINPPQPITTWLPQQTNTPNYVLALNNGSSIATLPKNNAITIAVGPEGDFSPAELDLAKSNNFHFLHLGPRILRAETAAPAAIAAFQLHMGDF